MMADLIFETDTLVIRKLKMSDIDPYHEMQSNPKVMRYVTGEVQTREEHLTELKWLLNLYDQPNNDFWIYAIDRKSDKEFIGTVAFIKDEEGDDEIGYRFLEKYWGMGYGYNLCLGAIEYCRSIGISKLIGYVITVNHASAKILEKCKFQFVRDGIDKDSKLPEKKYELIL